MKNKEWKPWEWYPEIWSTESKFWTYVRGNLRKALWNLSPAKLSFKNANCDLPPEGYTGRAKTGQYCALTGEWEGKSKLEVDHITGNVSLTCEDDLLDFVKHLVPHPDNMQLVKKEAHKIKSYAERKGITFEEARVEKEVIQIIKERRDKEVLEKNNIEVGSNAKIRRQQLKELLKGD